MRSSILTVISRVLPALLFALALSGCGGKSGVESDHADGGGHHHDPPHGGTGVTLGDEENHLEFVLERDAGQMRAYVLSAHMAEFVRIGQDSFEVTARLPQREETLVFRPVASAATGETAGDSSLFEARADWLRTNSTFDAVLKEITIKGKRYQSVAFNFPKGN